MGHRMLGFILRPTIPCVSLPFPVCRRNRQSKECQWTVGGDAWKKSSEPHFTSGIPADAAKSLGWASHIRPAQPASADSAILLGQKCNRVRRKQRYLLNSEERFEPIPNAPCNKGQFTNPYAQDGHLGKVSRPSVQGMSQDVLGVCDEGMRRSTFRSHVYADATVSTMSAPTSVCVSSQK